MILWIWFGGFISFSIGAVIEFMNDKHQPVSWNFLLGLIICAIFWPIAEGWSFYLAWRQL